LGTTGTNENVIDEQIKKNNFIFWDIKPCSPFKVNRRFGGNISPPSSGRSKACHLPHDGFLLRLFDPEDGGTMFLRNIGWLSTDYTALYHRRQNFINTAVRNLIVQIKRILNSGNASYQPVQNLLFPHLLPKNFKIKIYRTIILQAVLYGCKTWSLTFKEKRHRKEVWEDSV
jgi:hypothetical protein